jgi:Uma2 family endonuclease
MSTETAASLLTADEFSEWVMRPENQSRRYELVRGKVVEMSRPGDRHGLVCANAAFVLGLYIRERRKGYVLCNDSGVILERDPDTVRGPDVMYFEKSKSYDQMNPKFTEHVPTLAVEILSPNDRHSKTVRRIAEFQKAGIPLVWVIDPDPCDVTVYRPGREPYVIEGEQELTGDDVLPEFRCPIVDFFYSPDEQGIEAAK